MLFSAGKRLKEAMTHEYPLQMVGVPNAYTALMAKECGFQALYLSGAGVANNAFALPDLGVTSLDNVLEEVRRITQTVSLPLLVDIDTGWGNLLTLKRAISCLEQAGAAGVHLEDQVPEKRCGHLPGKTLVSEELMCQRIATAVQARRDPDFVIMARCDALAVEGVETTTKRLKAYKESGADMLFPEALTELSQYRQIKQEVDLPILANITEFGKTPLFTVEELKSVGVDIALYPLSLSRAMNFAALRTLKSIKSEGTQQRCLKQMQTRKELYEFLNYAKHEKVLEKGELP